MPRWLLLVPVALALGCGSTPPPKAGPMRPTVYVTNEPLRAFATAVGGDAVDVRFPAPADEDPAFWKPDAATVGEYQKADLILVNGADYERWVTTAALPLKTRVDTAAALRDAFIKVEGVTHAHGPAGTHSHAGTAGTTWIDFQQAARQGVAVRDALIALRPADREQIAANAAALDKQLLDFDATMLALAKQAPGRPLVASHPVYQYWARRYGLNLKSVLWEPDAVPSAEQIVELKSLLAQHPAKWMVWEDEPIPAAVEAVKALGLGSVVFAPCGNRPKAGDFLGRMRANLESVKRAFAP